MYQTILLGCGMKLPAGLRQVTTPCIFRAPDAGVFRILGWEYGVDYGVLTAPGTQGYFGVSIDGFVVPRVPERGERSAGPTWSATPRSRLRSVWPRSILLC